MLLTPDTLEDVHFFRFLTFSNHIFSFLDSALLLDSASQGVSSRSQETLGEPCGYVCGREESFLRPFCGISEPPLPPPRALLSQRSPRRPREKADAACHACALLCRPCMPRHSRGAPPPGSAVRPATPALPRASLSLLFYCRSFSSTPGRLFCCHLQEEQLQTCSPNTGPKVVGFIFINMQTCIFRNFC